MNILIVDDSKTILKTLKYNLESVLGLTVYTAASMKECADLILKHKGKFTLALLDYNLPDAQNGEILTFIQKFKIPSLLLTGSELQKDNPIFTNQYLIDYVIKNSSYAIDYTVAVVKRFIKNKDIEVLVLDDSKTFAFKMENLCKKYNLKTVVNYSAKEALETITQRPNIKLILVDYMMPQMNGLEFTKELRKNYKKDEVSVIALSGTSEKEIVASFFKYGANDFLYKDFSDEEFIARLNNNLELIELFTVTQDKAKKDYLTGLFNKEYLYNTGESLYERAKKKKELFAAIVIEIDNLNVVNDSYGHEVGDMVIKEVADFLLASLNKDVIIGRVGPEQFCILLRKRAYGEIHQVFEQIKEDVSNMIVQYEDIKIQSTISIGINLEFDENLSEMIELADEALAIAVHKGKNQIVFNNDF